MFVITNFHIVGLQFKQPIGHGLLWLWGLNDRQGVDKQPQYFIRCLKAGGASGDGTAKTHTVLSRVAL